MSIYQDLVEAMLPSDILLFFDVVDFKKEQDHYRIYLEEKNEVPSQYQKEHVRANGFLPEIKLQDFPIRDKFLILHLKQRRWLLVKDNIKIKRDWSIAAQGTRLSKEFAAFLKELH